MDGRISRIIHNNHCGDDDHLEPSSPAIGRGVEAGVATDFDGESRLGAPDLGADEYVAYLNLPLVLPSVFLTRRCKMEG